MKILSAENFTKRYGENTILENVSFDVAQGEVISIIGPSGTGKSTLLRGLNFLDPPTEGTICFKDQKLSKQNIDEARRKMVMVFQSFGLFANMDVMKNITIGQTDLLKKPLAEAEKRAHEILKTVGLSERAHHFPHQLSGGQKQRVAIARCLAMEPDIILFDEPTSALDPTMVGEVTAVIRNLAKSGMTMLIVTHEMEFARNISSRVFFMDERGIYESGTPEEIFDKPQRPKTQTFIFKIKTFTFSVTSRDFDFIEMLSGIDDFCFRYAVDDKKANQLRLIAEELVLNVVAPQFGACELTVSFPESRDAYRVSVTYPGEDRDALETGDELSVALVRNTAKSIERSYDKDSDVNALKIEV
ncbi:MAG: amino acid ABC transporter ATP-binding protein [Gracilibacteraceae bacterium]|jgi:polar amino acid transport system ATP-binding protein|nr:amino acid ABC transporter ATP-binding protein [Gracilibacteraceae bacterium]